MASKLQNLRFLLHSNVTQNCVKRPYSSGLPENLRRNYEKFQRDDGVPVYLKGGVTDRLLLGVTCILIVGGLIDSFYTFMRLDKKH